MLRELHISNLAVIEDATIELEPGLNVFTGQTGAGKSLIIGAFELLLGLRSGGTSGQDAAGSMIRQGAQEARVTGSFELHDPVMLQQIATLIDEPLELGDPLLIVRKLFATGRSSVSINNKPATAATLREIGEVLVDIHGQHDHQFLLRPSNQRDILDSFAKANDLREQYAELYHTWRELKERQQQLAASQSLRQQQLELYQFQAEEIDTISPQEGEYLELQARFNLLSNLAHIRKQADGVQQALNEAEGSVVDRLQVMSHVLGELAELDVAGLHETHQQVREATLALEEAAFNLSRYINRLEVDSGELAEVEERLNQLNRLIQKYTDAPLPKTRSRTLQGSHEHGDAPSTQEVDPLQPVIETREKIEASIKHLTGETQDYSQIDQMLTQQEQQLHALAKQLHEVRQKAAKKLKPMIEAQMHELGMADARFDVRITAHDLHNEQAGPSGCDTLEFLVQTNPGMDAHPLRRIASGGELSRVMLALKSILANSDRVSVLVFDEIDANIGGRLGSVIGQKLRNIAGNANNPSQQVLCITHLPQIAAFGNRHLHISKAVTGRGAQKQTHTRVTPLEKDARIEELAEMMAGKDITPTARKQAAELLIAAQKSIE